MLNATARYTGATMPANEIKLIEKEIEVLRELLNCIESALKALERSNKKREPRLKTVRVNLQVSRNLVRHFLSGLGAPYPPP